jgi:hypothetical protein
MSLSSRVGHLGKFPQLDREAVVLAVGPQNALHVRTPVESSVDWNSEGYQTASRSTAERLFSLTSRLPFDITQEPCIPRVEKSDGPVPCRAHEVCRVEIQPDLITGVRVWNPGPSNVLNRGGMSR